MIGRIGPTALSHVEAAQLGLALSRSGAAPATAVSPLSMDDLSSLSVHNQGPRVASEASWAPSMQGRCRVNRHRVIAARRNRGFCIHRKNKSKTGFRFLGCFSLRMLGPLRGQLRGSHTSLKELSIGPPGMHRRWQ